MVVLSLCLLLGSCPEDKGDLDIDIGDYEGQLAAWNSQNMLDYQIYVGRSSGGGPINARFIVRNGISECTDPSGWGDMFYSTIPEYFSLVKKIEKNLTDEYNNGHKRSLSLRVSYNTEYHYPSKIISISDVSYASRSYSVSLMPFEEGEIEIDIGDYESQLAAWNSQNMLDYRFMVECYCGYYGKKYREEEIYTVRNGVNVKDGPFITSSFINRKNIKTIPEIFSFIKAEEERIGNEYNGIYRSYLTVQYDPNYHYPVQINSRIGHLFGEYEHWKITLTPVGK
jgi:hypothetical protein